MHLVHRDVGNLRIVEVCDARIDAAVAISFKDQMRELSQDAPNRILLDLHAVDFLDSSGLGAVVAAMKQIGTGSSMELAGLTKTVARVFALTRMDTVFTIHADVDTAISGGLANAS